jgi:hypothetical protein
LKPWYDSNAFISLISQTENDGDEGEWFGFDVETFPSRKTPDSWHYRLNTVASMLVIQWIRINFGFTGAGGKSSEPSETSCELLLAAVPTEATSDGTYPLFGIADLSLRDLMDYAMDEVKPESISWTDALVNELT